MTTRKRVFLVLLTICLSIACDQVTKTIAKAHLPKTRDLSFAGDTLRLDYNVNKGGTFHFEEFLPEEWRGGAVSVATGLFLGGVALLMLAGTGLRPLSTTGLSLFCGGGFSNLLDRVALGGNVVDFLNFGWGGFRTAIFNVADVAIVAGSMLFMLNMVWGLVRGPRFRAHSGPSVRPDRDPG